ncbi:MAG: Fe-S cluster-containing hydrogenase [Terriglobales bacterium]
MGGGEFIATESSALRMDNRNQQMEAELRAAAPGGQRLGPAADSGASAAAELAADAAQPWTTLAQLAGDPEVAALAAREFKTDPRPRTPPALFPILGQTVAPAAPAGDEKTGGVDRRKFLQWSTAAMALATAACARKPVHYLVPYAQQPPEIIPGMASFYATTCQECSAACGLVVKTRDGRPIKVEGNPEHPINAGKVCARGQATFLNLYDPDRLPHPIRLVRGQVPPPAAEPRSPFPYFNAASTAQNYDLNGDPGTVPPQTTPGQPLAWAEIDQEVAAALRRAGTSGVLLTGTMHGPARTQLIADFTAFFGARHVVYDAFNPDALLAGQAASYGAGVVPRYFFGRAEMVVTFGADPLAQSASPLENSIGFGHQRKLRLRTGGDPVQASLAARKEGYQPQRMSRVVAFEPAMSQTGLNADSRYYVLPQDLLPVALAVAHQLVVVDQRSPFAKDATVTAALAPFAPAEIEKTAGLQPGIVAQTAAELWRHRGKGIVYASGLAAATPQAAELEAVAAFLNAALGNEGATVDGTASPSQQMQGSNAAMLALCEDMRAGKVQAIVIYGTNPAYTLPQAADFAAALAKVPYVVVVGERLDETGRLANVVLSSLHGQESWGDAEPQKGLYSLVQPTIEPLFDARAFEDSLIAIARAAGSTRFEHEVVTPAAPAVAAAPALTGAAAKGKAAKSPAAKPAASKPTVKREPMNFHAYIQQVWKKQLYGKYQLAGSWEDFWTGALRQGYFDPLAPQRANPGAARSYRLAALTAAAQAAATAAPRPSGEEFAFSLVASPMMGDGRCANNGFLLEIPDPVAKICWDNFVAISPAAAQRLGLTHGDVVEFEANGVRLRAPLHLQPGVHPQAATLAVGWGRTSVGMIGNNVGVNAFPLGAVQGEQIVSSGALMRLRKVASGYNMAAPQGSNYLEGRDVALATTLRQLRSNPRAGNVPAPPDESIWHNGGPSDHTYSGHHWGMSIDLNACIGCNACMAACHAENNVPIVGKEQVQVGREMDWIRIDRYYTGGFENPEIILEPMLCQQCANASCESVCPVIATITNGEGINVQIYNRCVGTRFCSNNCPYKVRRFNFYAYGEIQYDRGAPLELALNPDVTLRSRGVMEKCNFCLQRINAAHIKSQQLGVPIPDGGFQTACQQTCPSEAIYFGDMNDPNSQMMQARGPRGFKVLAGVNNLPTIDYQLKVHNIPARKSAEDQA